MKITFDIPEVWLKAAKDCNVPEDKLESFFQYYIESVLGIEYDTIGSDFDIWLEGDDAEVWLQDNIT